MKNISVISCFVILLSSSLVNAEAVVSVKSQSEILALRSWESSYDKAFELLRRAYPEYVKDSFTEKMPGGKEYTTDLRCYGLFPKSSANERDEIAFLSSGFYVSEIHFMPLAQAVPRFVGDDEVRRAIPIHFVYKSLISDETMNRKQGSCFMDRRLTRDPNGSGYD